MELMLFQDFGPGPLQKARMQPDHLHLAEGLRVLVKTDRPMVLQGHQAG